MRALPGPRGPTSAALLAALLRPPHDLAPVPLPAGPDPLADEDLQLALYLCYELHYRGLPGVDERWEWSPALLAVRAALEARFEAALRAAVGPVAAPDAPEEMDLALRAVAAADTAPSVSRFVEREAGLDQVLEFLVHRSAYQLKEADPHSWAIPRLSGPPKAALVEIQADEYGGGRPERMHAQLFADAMAAAGLDPTLRRLSRAPAGGDARHRQPDVAVRPAPAPARRHRRPPGAVRDVLLDPQPALRERPAAARARRRDAVLRRARDGRRRARERRGGRSRRRAGPARARAGRGHRLGRPRAGRGRGPLGRPSDGVLGARDARPCGRRYSPRPEPSRLAPRCSAP